MSHAHGRRASCGLRLLSPWFHFDLFSLAGGVTDVGVGSGALLALFRFRFSLMPFSYGRTERLAYKPRDAPFFLFGEPPRSKKDKPEPRISHRQQQDFETSNRRELAIRDGVQLP